MTWSTAFSDVTRHQLDCQLSSEPHPSTEHLPSIDRQITGSTPEGQTGRYDRSSLGRSSFFRSPSRWTPQYTFQQLSLDCQFSYDHQIYRSSHTRNRQVDSVMDCQLFRDWHSLIDCGSQVCQDWHSADTHLEKHRGIITHLNVTHAIVVILRIDKLDQINRGTLIEVRQVNVTGGTNLHPKSILVLTAWRIAIGRSLWLLRMWCFSGSSSLPEGSPSTVMALLGITFCLVHLTTSALPWYRSHRSICLQYRPYIMGYSIWLCFVSGSSNLYSIGATWLLFRQDTSGFYDPILTDHVIYSHQSPKVEVVDPSVMLYWIADQLVLPHSVSEDDQRSGFVDSSSATVTLPLKSIFTDVRANLDQAFASFWRQKDRLLSQWDALYGIHS